MLRSSQALAMVLLLGCGRVGYDPGSSDGGSADLDAAAQVDECAARHAGARVCSGFEGDVGTYWSLTTRDGGTIATTTTVAHRGARALRAEVGGSGSTAFAHHRFVPIASGDLWLRAFVRVPAPSGSVGVNLLAVEHEGSDVFGIDVNVGVDGRLLVYGVEAGTFDAPDDVRLRADEWACVELRIGVSDADGELELFVDGARAVSATGIDSYPEGDYDRLLVGVAWSDASQAPFEVLIDDVVLDVQPIGCD
ncbi:LamG-like jellyroll fold domain-containing protein [Sandaracinus amylolyticus]|uniref:Cip1-like core domain-containing protein n=1 Tax=Sandaracinus amylolyticus TaxID=927083 RepID=A0A0F6W179_9BACT|nr:hypothetical protein [Sandaracinus amylolyticus]AKF04805.1 hypothetical protein DB32_001954 [Sandaracinus amylolyticus]